ncbi:MAG: DUF3667 domain-containing protein [Chitinophagaceae bacterium]|nr:DUF3667 domain-containing protein [Chitinophagaceae bacterium]
MHETIVCKNCGNQFEGKYCNVCGQKTHSDHDKKIVHFVEDAFHFLTHFDGRLFVTLKTIFRTPGKYAEDFSNGITQRYFKPLSLFLLLVVLYLLFPLFMGLNVHLSQQKLGFLKGITAPIIERKLAATNLSMTELSYIYAQKSEKVSKILLLIVIPMFAFLLKLLFSKRKKYFYDHLLLSTEINIFNLLFNYLIFALFLTLIQKVPFFSDGMPAFVMFILGYLLYALYLVAAFKQFYRVGTVHSVIKTLLFLVGDFLILFIIYRLILFLVVMAFI